MSGIGPEEDRPVSVQSKAKAAVPLTTALRTLNSQIRSANSPKYARLCAAKFMIGFAGGRLFN